MASLHTIDEQVTAIVAILGGVTGDLTHLGEHPLALNSLTLPCTVTSPGPAQYERDERGAGHLRVTRQMRIKVFLMPATEGFEYQAERTLKPYLTSIPLQLARYSIVRLDDGTTFEMTLDRGSDSGLSQLRYGSQYYYGTLFTVTTVTDGIVQPER